MDNPILGLIMSFAGSFAPRGFMSCEGQLLQISQQTALFSILGTEFGGDGQQTFALPDLRGRALIGSGQGPGLASYDIGQAAGKESYTLLINNMPQHNHNVTLMCNADGSSTSDPNNAYMAIATENIYAGTGGTAMAAQPNAAVPSGGSQPIELLNPYLAMYQCIVVEGIFPTRN